MFGHHPLLERELRKKGRRAFATVLQSERTNIVERRGDPSLVSDAQILWRFVMRVEPEGEPPFEAKTELLLPQTWAPEAGSRFSVLFDPANHKKVLIDQSDEGNRLLDAATEQERVDGTVARMRSSGQNEIADRYKMIHDPALGLFGTDNLSSDPDERRRQLAERRAKIKEIMAGDGLMIDSRPAQPRAASAAAMGTSAAASAAAAADALTKLADLRDRGALTDEEFQAQKKKLLGE